MVFSQRSLGIRLCNPAYGTEIVKRLPNISHPTDPPRIFPGFLQVGLGFGLFEDGLQLGGFHNVALDLELPAHEEALSVALALDEVAKVLFGEEKRDYSPARIIA